MSSRIFSLLCLIALEVWAIPPVPLQNYCPIVIENATGLAASEVYFIAHGLDDTGIPCFLVPDPTTGVCSYIYPGADGSNGSVESSRTLSQMPVATGTAATNTAYLIYLPINVSSRGYISIQQPLFIETDSSPQTGYVLISDPAVTSLNDPNFYTLYQDFEFGFGEAQVDSSTQLYLNLSWVDYFCLPMELKSYSYPSNTLITINTTQRFQQVVPAGTTASLTRENIITTVNNLLSSYQTTANTWSALGLLYYDNPYTQTTSTNYLRILAAKNSLSFGSSGVTFEGGATTQAYFPANYVSNSAAGPSASTSYMQAAYNYYSSNAPLSAQIKPAGIAFTTYTISSVTTGSGPTDLTLKFITTDLSDNNLALDLATLTTEELLSGSVWPFYALTMSDQVNAAITNELSKLISALFTVGQFPFTAYATSVGSPFPNTNQGYATLSYFSNPTGFSNGPWWNGYDKAMHLQMISQGSVPENPSLGFCYAYDFDDLLNMSGLVGGVDVQNAYANPSTDPVATQPYFMITMESLSGTTIPNISEDTYSYTVSVGPAANGTPVAFSYYTGTTTLTATASLSSNTPLTPAVHVDADHPFIVTFSPDGDEHSFSINLLHQAVTPIAPPGSPPGTIPSFSGTDRKYQSGIKFTIPNAPSANPTFFITFDSTPPPWSQ